MICTDTGIVPPLIYAMLASSREMVIGPGSVDSLILSSMIQTLKVSVDDSVTYTQLVFTVTFFAGIFQVAFGIFRSVLSSCILLVILFTLNNKSKSFKLAWTYGLCIWKMECIV